MMAGDSDPDATATALRMLAVMFPNTFQLLLLTLSTDPAAFTVTMTDFMRPPDE